MPTKILWIKTSFDQDHPFEPNKVEYDVATIIDGEPDYQANGGGISGRRIDFEITDETTRGEIKAACLADAVTNGWMPAP